MKRFALHIRGWVILNANIPIAMNSMLEVLWFQIKLVLPYKCLYSKELWLEHTYSIILVPYVLDFFVFYVSKVHVFWHLLCMCKAQGSKIWKLRLKKMKTIISDIVSANLSKQMHLMRLGKCWIIILISTLDGAIY